MYVLSSNRSHSPSFVSFGFNVKLLEFLGGPWGPFAFLVWVHETIYLFDVLVYIGLS